MTKTLHGTIRGRTILLYDDPGIGDGQEVEIAMTVVSQASRTPGEGFRRTEGSLADDEEWDRVMEEVHQARQWERTT